MPQTGLRAESVVRHDPADQHVKTLIRYDAAVSPNLTAGDVSDVSAYPSACRTSDGIVCVYRRGTAKHCRNGVLMAQSSDPSGEFWSAPTVVFDGMRGEQPESVHSGVVCSLNGVSLAFFKTVEAKRAGVYIFSEEGRRLRQRAYMCRSDDGGRRWSAPIEIDIQGGPRDTFLGSRPLALPSGRLLIPVEATGKHGQQLMMGCFSDDGGQTFTTLSNIAHDATGRLGFGDGKLALLPDGHIVMLAWTYINSTEETIKVHRCVSLDGGHTWSPLEPTNNLCQIMAPLSLSDGRLIAAGTVRSHSAGIRLYRSVDAGVTWIGTPVQLWDARESRITAVPLAGDLTPIDDKSIWNELPSFTFGCPELTMLDGGDVLLTYYATVNEVTHVRACRIAMKTRRRLGQGHGTSASRESIGKVTDRGLSDYA